MREDNNKIFIYSNPSPYKLSLSVKDILSIYVESLSRELNYEVSRSILFIPSYAQSIRLVTMFSNSYQAFYERSYAPRINLRSVTLRRAPSRPVTLRRNEG
jgi:hypothetical protein